MSLLGADCRPGQEGLLLAEHEPNGVGNKDQIFGIPTTWPVLEKPNIPLLKLPRDESHPAMVANVTAFAESAVKVADQPTIAVTQSLSNGHLRQSQRCVIL